MACINCQLKSILPVQRTEDQAVILREIDEKDNRFASRETT